MDLNSKIFNLLKKEIESKGYRYGGSKDIDAHGHKEVYFWQGVVSDLKVIKFKHIKDMEIFLDNLEGASGNV